MILCLSTLKTHIVSKTKNVKNMANDIIGNISIPAIDSK
jgi:hypothetical protein